MQVSNPSHDGASGGGNEIIRHRSDGTLLFTIRIDPVAQIARSHAVGFWTLLEAREFVAALTDIMTRLRRNYLHARVLCDISGMPVQSDDVSQCLGEANAKLFGASDRLALIVDSYLVRGQMRRRFARDNSQAFLSPSAAETWLRA